MGRDINCPREAACDTTPMTLAEVQQQQQQQRSLLHIGKQQQHNICAAWHTLPACGYWEGLGLYGSMSVCSDLSQDVPYLQWWPVEPCD
jgi:hypothetical protein